MENFSNEDIKYFESIGISLEKVNKYIENFKKGFPFTQITKPCVINDGLHIIDESEFTKLIEVSEKASNESRMIKFVPASGAASRMFKTLNYFNNNYEKINYNNIKMLAEQGDKEAKELYKFIQGIKRFAFFDDLKIALDKDNYDIDNLIQIGEYKEIVDYLLNEKGLNYADLPKGLLKFHKYNDDEIRTSIEEHLVEGANYTKDKNNQVKIHFTVSPEHLEHIQNHVDQAKVKYEEKYNVKYFVSFSIQKKSTDTIAVDLNNNPFYDNDKILFRPAGHGALIENLDDLKADIIFIKNIDNVVPDKLKETTYTYKKALSGYLINIQDKCFKFLKQIENNDIDEKEINIIFNFLEKELFIHVSDNIKNNTLDLKKDFIFSKLNRPIRVCGMVKNQGEPGGGPFWTKSENTESVQIVETSQIDLNSYNQKDLLSKATHFNPVDLICAVKDYKGDNFDLEKYIDHNTGFISQKSKDGRDLKALELPGLWNGAMADWNTIFIEVPLITFNPVKTVNDLLRPEHQ